MAVSLHTSCAPRTEMSIQEINQELRSQLAKSKQDFRDLTEKFLISQATAYSLANQLQKYKPRQYKDILESVLGEKLQFEEEELAEKPGPAVRLRKHISPIHDQLQELIQMRQKLQVGRDVSYKLHQLFRDLLTSNEPDSSQWSNFREKLDQGGKLAECLYHELQSENPEAVEGEEELLLAARLKSQTEEAEKENEVLQDSVEECYLTPSSLHDLPDSLGPRRSSGFLFDDYKFDLAVDEAQNPEAVEGEEGLLPAARLKSQTEEAEKENEVLQDSVEECYLTPSSLHDLPDSLGPRRSSGFLLDDYKFDLAVDEAQNQSSHKDERGKESMALSRLFMEQQEVEGMNETEEDKLDEDNLTPFHCHDFPDAHQPPSSTTFMSDEQGVCSPLSAAKHQSYHKDEKGQESMGPRLFREQQEAEGMNETEQDTRDEQRLSDFLCHELPDAHQPPWSTTLMSDEQEVCSSLSAAKNQKKYQDIKRNKPVVLTKYHFLIQYQARELSQLRKNLREGRWVSDFLDERLKGLLTHKDSDNLHMRHLPEKLTELHRLTERLYSKISAGENHEYKKYEDIQGQPVPRGFDFLIEHQARELTELRQKVQEGRQASFLLKEHFKHLLSHKDDYQTQSFLEQLAEGCMMAKHLACKLSTENHEDEEDEEEQESPALSPIKLSREPQKDKMMDDLQDSKDGDYLSPSSHPGLLDSHLPSCSTCPLFHEHGACCVLDVGSLKTSCKLECDSLENSAANNHGCKVIGHNDATSALKQKILKRKLLLSKRRLACRFPGLHTQTEIQSTAGRYH
ncbi:NBPF family member NBPF6-like [Dasypus novemcinctus]|uniref:NBPF family member NBPF6-like n=1 Tax=Dasypus novemcinctus TaxID=9361 RepID=UPI00265FAB58|nr:neuroblastoma breakpoint family member 6-like [Dasypus novemcinctus]